MNEKIHTETNPGWSTDGLAGSEFATVEPADEFLHAVPADASYTHTETSYWGFCVPDRNLMAEIYIWFHPVLGTMSAGVLLFTGKRGSSLAADFVHHHHFLPMPDAIDSYRIEPVGLEIQVLEPLREIRMRHQDPDRDVSFDVLFSAAMPPVGRPNGHHLIQVMRTTGELELYGESIPIDGYFTRDRSWGADRFETPMDVPPITWMTGNASDDLAFHLVAFDEPSLRPDWLDHYERPVAGDNLMWGFIRRKGETRSIRRAAKLTRRAADGVTPDGFTLQLEDVAGDVLDLEGTITAQAPWATWQNVVVWYSLTRWEIDGQEAWGDCQDIQYNRYVHTFSRS